MFVLTALYVMAMTGFSGKSRVPMRQLQKMLDHPIVQSAVELYKKDASPSMVERVASKYTASDVYSLANIAKQLQSKTIFSVEDVTALMDSKNKAEAMQEMLTEKGVNVDQCPVHLTKRATYSSFSRGLVVAGVLALIAAIVVGILGSHYEYLREADVNVKIVNYCPEIMKDACAANNKLCPDSMRSGILSTGTRPDSLDPNSPDYQACVNNKALIEQRHTGFLVGVIVSPITAFVCWFFAFISKDMYLRF